MGEADDQIEWWNIWGKLQAAARDLDAAVTQLQQQRAYALARPNLRAEFEAQEQEIESARGRVAWLRDAIKSVMSFFGVELSGLGFVPLIPIAVVTAGVAYIANIAASAWSLSKRIDEQRRLESQGVPPAQAAQIVTQTSSAGGMFSGFKDVKDVMVLLALGVGAWFLWKNMR